MPHAAMARRAAGWPASRWALTAIVCFPIAGPRRLFMADTPPLEGWERATLHQIRTVVFDDGWMRHLPPMGGMLIGAMPIFDQPPTEADLAKVIGSPSNPEASWDGSVWDLPTRMTAQE